MIAGVAQSRADSAINASACVANCSITVASYPGLGARSTASLRVNGDSCGSRMRHESTNASNSTGCVTNPSAIWSGVYAVPSRPTKSSRGSPFGTPSMPRTPLVSAAATDRSRMLNQRVIVTCTPGVLTRYFEPASESDSPSAICSVSPSFSDRSTPSTKTSGSPEVAYTSTEWAPYSTATAKMLVGGASIADGLWRAVTRIAGRPGLSARSAYTYSPTVCASQWAPSNDQACGSPQAPPVRIGAWLHAGGMAG